MLELTTPFSEEEMECFVKTLISYRDGTKLPIFDSSKIYNTSDDEKIKAMIFRTPDNKEKIEVVITWKAGDMTSEILTYAGSENLVRFVPKSLAEECCKTARNICSKNFDKEEQKKDSYLDLIKLKEKSFAEKIKICRTSHGYSKEEVADCIGVSHSTFGRWESGYTKVPAPKNIKSVKELAELFEVPYEWLVYGLGLISPVEKDLKAIFDPVSGAAKSDRKDTEKTPAIEDKKKDLPISDLRELLPEEEAAPEKDKTGGDFLKELEKLAAKAEDEFISEKPDQKDNAILFVPAKEEREDGSS